MRTKETRWGLLIAFGAGCLFSPPPVLAILQKVPGYILVVLLSYWPGWPAALSVTIAFMAWHTFGMVTWGGQSLDIGRREEFGGPRTYQETRTLHFLFWSNLSGLLIYGVLLVMIVFGSIPLYAQMGF